MADAATATAPDAAQKGSAASAPNDPQAGNGVSIWRRVRRDALLLGGGNLGIVAAQLGFRSILVVVLVPAAYGRLSLILSLYNTVFLIGASGLPNSVARYISISSADEDAGVVRSALRAGAWPTAVASLAIAVVAGVLLHTPLACVFAAIGLASMVYSLVMTGVLRGRSRIGAAASIQPIAAIAEVAPLAALWLSGVHVTPLGAFGVFCLGNVVGLVASLLCAARTAPRRIDGHVESGHRLGYVPAARELLGFSVWLGLATLGVALLPLVMRFAAAFDSYSVVAVVDIALVLLSIPQRVGTVIVQAVVPHATRALKSNRVGLSISRREHLAMVAPFVLIAALVWSTPAVRLTFGLLGRPHYGRASSYLALALLAGPPRVLYGLVQGILVAHGDGRFLARTSLSVTAVASVLVLLAAALGSVLAAFAVFAIACWVVYLLALRRVAKLESAAPGSVPPATATGAIAV